MPKSVKLAVILMSISLLISAFLNLIELKFNIIDEFEFIGVLIILTLFCIIPYFISKGSNGFRWTSLILTIFSLFAFMGFDFGIESNLEKLDILQSLIFSFISLYLLFIPQDAKSFFSQ